MMNKFVLGVLGFFLLSLAPVAKAQLRYDGPAKAGLAFGEDMSSDQGHAFWKKKRRKRKRRKKRTLAVGVVVGGPAQFGGRALLRLGNFGIAGDIAYNRVRSDRGPLVDAMVNKLDVRLYNPGFIAKIFRIYTFMGLTAQTGRWDDDIRQSVYSVDAGIGGGLKLFRLSVNAEAGLLLPVRKLEAYNPGFGAFANISVLMWLF